MISSVVVWDHFNDITSALRFIWEKRIKAKQSLFFSVCPKLLYFWFTLRIDKVWQYTIQEKKSSKQEEEFVFVLTEDGTD